jgi:predicted aminopeptidase
MRWLLLFFESLLLFIFFMVVFNMSMAKYLYFQAKGQLKIIVEAEPIEAAISGNGYSEKEKNALRLIQNIKQFSVDTFGFKSIKNYTTVYNQGNKPILWITTACQPFSFEVYNWDFPYLGKVGYKGFFNKAKAEVELSRLQSLGLDADLGTVSGWSTLGWLPEPVLSNWLKRDDAELANLIFHELFHGTVYVKNEVDLNENLASFIADKATMYFLKTDSLKWKKYSMESKDEKFINDYALNYKLILKNAYNQWNKMQLPNAIKQAKKDSILKLFVANVRGLKLQDTSFIQRYLKKSLKAKNAFFMHFERYDSKYDSLNLVFQQKFNGNLKSYINYLKINKQSL